MRICLACRHPVGERCELEGHEVVDLDARGRERLIGEVWGDRETRAELRARSRAGRRALGAGGTAGVATAAGLWVLVGAAPPLMIMGGLFAAASIGGFAGLVRRTHEDPRFPRAAVPRPASARFAVGTIVDAGEDERSPASGLWCAAWAIELSVSRRDGARTVFRDAWCAGLEILVDGGARARVAPGPWRPAGALVPLADWDDLAIEKHLRGVDPAYDVHDELAPFHHDAVAEMLLRVGDRVALCGAWTPAPDDRGDESLYRDAPATALVADGWPALGRTDT
jgi:hypothetical protein